MKHLFDNIKGVAKCLKVGRDIWRIKVARLRLHRKLLKLPSDDLGQVAVAAAALGAAVSPHDGDQALHVERQGQQQQKLQPLGVDARRVFHQRPQTALEQHLREKKCSKKIAPKV